MLRKIIKIDESQCNGCGACDAACHEGAIEIIGGKKGFVATTKICFGKDG